MIHIGHLVSGLFKNSKKAGEAVAELKDKGYTDSISVIAKNWDDTEVKTHEVKPDSVAEGGIAGAVVGGLAGLIVGTSALLVPGIGTLIVAGPLAATLGVAGALAGGLIGALIDAGIPEERARLYEDAIKRGEVLVAVSVDHSDEEAVSKILASHDVHDTDILHAEN